MDLGFEAWLVRLVTAALLSSLVGWHREAMHKQAGLRTHMLVGIGAALFTLVGIEGFGDADESRIAAQVVTGVGFLGAGAIFRQGVNVTGLTTAAGLWAVAAIGITAGAGIVDGAVLATAITLFVLIVLGWVERRGHDRHLAVSRDMEVIFGDITGLNKALSMLEQVDPEAMDVRVRHLGEGSTAMTVPVTPDKRDVVAAMMRACDGVIAAG